MSNAPLIRNISDTAAWVALYRAMESDRPDAVFRDPYARHLAGTRGQQIMEKMSVAKKYAWSYVARTYVLDTYIAQEVVAGADMVINLAAGLDTRPYRMQLPASLQWIEVDLKGKVLGRWEVGAEWAPEAFTQSGTLYTQDGDAVLMFDRSTKAWRRVADTPAGFLLGADGDSLVFEVRGTSRLRWVLASQ